MKNNKCLLFFVALLPTISFGQGGSPGNTRVSGAQFLGYNAGIPGSLEIRNDFNQPILFGTNGAIRMKIDNGGNGANNGRIGIGNNLPAVFAPMGRVHIHQTAGLGFTNAPYVRFTTNTTGATASDGFVIGNVTNGLGLTGDVYIANYEARTHISMQTDNSGTLAGGVLFERVRFNSDEYNGFVGIGNSGAFNAAAKV